MNAYVKSSGIVGAGNGLFCSKGVGPGQLIFSLPRPLVSSLDAHCLPNICSNCFAQATGHDAQGLVDTHETTVKACNGCKTLRYCSKQCQVESWKLHHKQECKIFSSLASKGILPSAARAVFQMLHILATVEPSPFKGLDSHLDKIKASGGQRYETLLALSTGVHNYSGTKLSLDLVQHSFSTLQMNSFTLMTPTFDPLGVALDPFASKANHSCDPNALVVFDGAKMSFRSLKPIRKDQEIFISYVDITNPFHRRRWDLAEQYLFTCECPKCVRGPDITEDKFLRSPSSLPFGWDKDMKFAPGPFSDFSKQDLTNTSNFVGSDMASAILETRQRVAFSKLEEAKQAPTPSDGDLSALKILKQGIQACLQTKIWPECRQPLPALQHEAFVKLLSPAFKGLSWSYAFKQGWYIYSKIHPVLYPEPFHPLRVLHNWALVKLALFLADPGTPRTEDLNDVDFGVVAFGLLGMLRAVVDKSHGKDSEFCRMVLRMTNEVMVESTRLGKTKVLEMKDKIESQWAQLGTMNDMCAWMALL